MYLFNNGYLRSSYIHFNQSESTSVYTEILVRLALSSAFPFLSLCYYFVYIFHLYMLQNQQYILIIITLYNVNFLKKLREKREMDIHICIYIVCYIIFLFCKNFIGIKLISTAWITALSWQRGLSKSVKLRAMPGSVTQDGTGYSGEIWQNLVNWRRKHTPVFLPREFHGQYEKTKSGAAKNPATQAAAPPPNLALMQANPSPPGQPQEQTPVDNPQAQVEIKPQL